MNSQLYSNNQAYTIIAFFISGLIIGIIFDIFRITRKTFKLPNIITYIEDALFWILTGAIILFTIYVFTDGQIRLYMILMLIIGAFIYFMFASKYFIKINTKVLDFIKLIIRFIAKPFIKIGVILRKIFKKLNFFSKNSGK